MIKGKTRHQLFLPVELSKRLTAMAKAQKRARSELLLDAVEAWLSQRAAPSTDERITSRLDRIARELHSNARHQQIISENLNGLIHHQIIQAAGLPAPTAESRSRGEKQYQIYLDRLAQRLATGAENDNSTPEQTQPAAKAEGAR